MSLSRKYWICFYVFVFSAFTAVKAQDTIALTPEPTAIVYPTDLNPLKVDSFFIQRTIDLRQCNNADLYFEVFRWYKTCYRYGGNSNKGIDCSHFVNMLYEKLYQKTLGPSVGAIMEQCHIIKKGLKDVKEGDLLFFKIKKGAPSHTGIYLQNGMFAHASTHSGVIISSVEEPYYKKRFYKVGRVKEP